MISGIRRHTVDEFDEIVHLPENADKRLELVGGMIVEAVSNNYSSEIGALFVFFIQSHIRQQNIPGRVTGADGGYRIGDERYIPDAAFVSRNRQPESSHEAYNPTPPDLAVEVLSPTDDPVALRIKVVNYLRAGTAVWVVDLENKQAEVYAPDQSPRLYDINDTLDGGSVLPGFTLAIRDIFPE